MDCWWSWADGRLLCAVWPLLQLNKLVKEQLSSLPSTRLLAGLLADVVVAVRRLRELLAATAEPPPAAATVNDDVTETVRLLKMVLEPLEQQVRGRSGASGSVCVGVNAGGGGVGCDVCQFFNNQEL